MKDQQHTRLHKLKQGMQLVFAAAIDRTESKITPRWLLRIADRPFFDTLIPAESRTIDDVGSLFTNTGNIGLRFLAEVDITRKWMKSRLEINLTRTFERRLDFIDLYELKNMTTRRTRLDVLLNHVFERDLSTNFVVVHTDTPAFYDEGTVQKYMGMIYAARKQCGKKNCIVYGLATDSNEYWFYQVDNEGYWSHTVVKPMDEYFYEDIAGLLASILRKAHILSKERETSKMKPVSLLQIRKLPTRTNMKTPYDD
ncbi:hypothetical protein N7520_007972 [Penicillium odoratum]|uniref:uncharacterized protein n=1 Tax=Penicillium odoratum TaxID=1167516 RepID=UPI0025489711|nr:uncharacterized protein N7520_007972 [Penicillium odoratum]KAJ5760816.1 hypothetical protein N7520_007972 [Penicillium odoratum]